MSNVSRFPPISTDLNYDTLGVVKGPKAWVGRIPLQNIPRYCVIICPTVLSCYIFDDFGDRSPSQGHHAVDCVVPCRIEEADYTFDLVPVDPGHVT